MLQETPKLYKPYSKGVYNRFNADEQWIRISEGCPNKCPYCRESFENGTEPVYYEIPEIIRNNVKIIDMNLLYKPKALEIIKELGLKKVNGKAVYYELVCGIDYRYLTPDLAKALKDNRFKNIRIAWDYGFSHQKKIYEAISYLIKAGYNYREISVFILCNWKIPYNECLDKLDLLKIHRIKALDCYFDNQLMPKVKPIHWDIDQIKKFRKKVRTHNIMVNFGFNVEVK